MHHLKGGAGIEHLLAARIEPRHRFAVPFGQLAIGAAAIIRPPDHFARAILHIVDDARWKLQAIVSQRGIGVDHLLHGRFTRPQRERQVRRIFADPDPGEGVHDMIHPGVIRDPHGHQVARLLQSPAHRVRRAAAALPAKVLETLLAKAGPLIDAKLAVDHFA